MQRKSAARDFALDLNFAPTQAPLAQGENGVSRKGPDAAQASYYYSEPQLRVTGTLQIGAATASAVTGIAWLDHEWSSTVMAPEALGWDWTGINLADGGALMAFRNARQERRRPCGLAARIAMRKAMSAPSRRTRSGSCRDAPWRSPRTGHRIPGGNGD
jgi:predicted secreted hydrolase